MATFEDVDASGAASQSHQVAGMREAAMAVLALVEQKKGPGKLLSLSKTVSGVGSGAIGGAKGFRDAQKQKLLDVKQRLAESHASQQFGELKKETRLELEAAVAERDEPLGQEVLDRFAVLATEDQEQDGTATQALRWLISSSEQSEAALTKHKSLQHNP